MNDPYSRRLLRKRLIIYSLSALLAASVIYAHTKDDFSKLNHHAFHVTGIAADQSIQLSTGEAVQLLGVAETKTQAHDWLAARLVGREITLLLQSPQTRDSQHRIQAFVFQENENVNVELVKAGLAYADRREKTVMDGLLDPAEAEARKKKRGQWQHIAFGQMPAWRQAWLRSLPKRISSAP